MAVNQVFAFSPEKTREWLVPAGTTTGAAVISTSNQAGVALTTRPDVSVTKSYADGSTRTFLANTTGQTANSVTVATDGSWSFPVAGASGTTPKDTLVYAVVVSGAVTSLTLNSNAGANVKFGTVDSFPGKATSANTVVKIGVFA